MPRPYNGSSMQTVRAVIRHIICFTALLAVLPAFAQLPDEAAKQDHFFPLFVDGSGFQSYLFLTNASDLANQCALELHGEGLDATRFEAHDAVTPTGTGSGTGSGSGLGSGSGSGSGTGAGATIELNNPGASLTLASTGAGSLTFGYALLECAEPVVARILLTLSQSGSPLALTTLESSQVAASFQFPALPRLGSLGLLLSNNSNADVSCAVELLADFGVGQGGGNLAVPMKSTVLQILDELVAIPDEFGGGNVTVSCNREIASLGLSINGPLFAALPAVALEGDDRASSFHVLPLIVDGAGFQSQILVTNLSPFANQCALELHGPGLDIDRFSTDYEAMANGSSIPLPLFTTGDSVSIASIGSQSLAFGYATLDCNEPVAAQNLLTVSVADKPAGMTTIYSSQAADEFRFPVVPRAGSLALIFTNDSEFDAACAIELNDYAGVSAGERSASAPMKSTAVNFLDDLYDIPGEFPGGTATVSCDREINAVSLPISGAAFAALAPTVFSSTALEEDTAPVLDIESLIIGHIYTVGIPIEPLQLPEAGGGVAPLTYSLQPAVPGLSFDAAARRLTGTPIMPGIYSMSYSVRDANGDVDSYYFDILVVEPDTQPSFADDSGPGDQTYTLGTEIQPLQMPEATGGNAPLFYFLLEGEFFGPGVPGLEFDPESRQFRGAPSETGVYNMTYRVTDLDGDTDSLQFTITVVVPVTSESLINTDGCTDGSFIADSDNSDGLTADCRALAGFANALIETGLIEEDNVIRQWGTGGQVKLATWEGISVSDGRVTGVDLDRRDLKGDLPSELGQLGALEWLSLSQNELSGPIPPELGLLSELEWLSLSGNELTGAIPPEHGELSKLESLWLFSNKLSGAIPPELGRLDALEILSLGGNELTGEIPPELGELSSLQDLSIWGNELSGPIPAELSRLNNLNVLTLSQNQLSGEIPPELGELTLLESLDLGFNHLTSAIPPELGQLTNLTSLDLGFNELTGPIPPELGGMVNLEFMVLARNQLTGTIPEELAQPENLQVLFLEGNQLTGDVPWVFRERITQGGLELITWGNLITGLEAPPVRTRNPAYSSIPSSNGNAAHHSISYFQGPLMLEWNSEGVRVEHQTPILGRWAALAVTIEHAVPEPPLVITRVLDEQDVVLTESLAEAVPPTTEETEPGLWRSEYVFDLPGELYQAGNQIVHVIDPDDELAETNETDNMAEPIVLYGEEPPQFRATFIPLRFPDQEDWNLDVDPRVLMIDTHAFLPIADDFEARIGPMLELQPNNDPFYDPLIEIFELWNLEANPDEFYHGISTEPVGGVALLAGPVAMSELSIDLIIPHEFGHNLNLQHTPGCFADLADLGYPYPDGRLGPDRGWDVNWRRFISMDSRFTDVMSYCGESKFISDYHYRRASRYWLSQRSETSTSGVRAGDAPNSHSGGAPSLRTGDRRSPQSDDAPGLGNNEDGQVTSASQSADTGSLALSGQITAGGVWSLTQAQMSERAPRSPAEDGEYTLKLFDSAGVQVHSEPLAIIPVSEGDSSFWAARTPVPVRTAREIVIEDPQGAEVLRESLTL